MSRPVIIALRHVDEWEWLVCNNDKIGLCFDLSEDTCGWEAFEKSGLVYFKQANKHLFNENQGWIVESQGDGSVTLVSADRTSYLTKSVIESQGVAIDLNPECWMLEILFLPVLDYSMPDPELANFILEQCSQTGFFVLVNHPLSSHIPGLFSAARSSLISSGSHSSKKVSLLSSSSSSPPAWWLSSPPQEYYDSCKIVGSRLLNAIFDALEIRRDPEPIFNLRMMCYKDVGLEEHTDKDWLTILLQDPCFDGLEVEGRDSSNWVRVPCSDPVIVNIGDALQAVSGGRLKSKIHRAVAPADGMRVSFPMFIEPSSWPEAVIDTQFATTFIIREL